MDLTRPYPPDPYDYLPAVPAFTLTSDDIAEGQPMDVRHSTDGLNTSPHLAWDPVPGAQAYAVSCYDPDAPTPAGFWHWTWVNLPSTLTALPRGFGDSDRHLPPGVVRARNDGGTLDFTGAAPPPGDHPHRYIFAVHALDQVLELPAGLGCTPAAFNIIFHTIARGRLTATYQR